MTKKEQPAQQDNDEKIDKDAAVLLGNMRDDILNLFKQKADWKSMKEAQQKEVVASCEYIARELIRRTSNIIASRGFKAFHCTLDSVTINTLPSTFKITTGDLVSIGYASGARTLHKAMETVTASAGAASFAVEPVLLPGGPVGTAGAVTFAAPWCYATLDAGKPDVSWIHGRMAQISFNATQAYK